MLAAYFRNVLTKLDEPWRSVVQAMGDHANAYSNAVVWGVYPPGEKIEMNAWSIVGIVPGQRSFLECHAVTGTADDQVKPVSRLREIAAGFSPPADLTDIPFALLGGMIQGKLGISSVHAVGMLSLHRAPQSNQQAVALWIHPELNRPTVECVMKNVLNERLK